MTFGAHKLVHSEPFWTTYTKFDTLLSALDYMATCGKNFYIGALHTTFSALNYSGRIFFKSLSYLYEVVRTTFPPIFGLFEIFERNFAKLVAPPSNNYQNYLVQLKGQSMLIML